MKNFKKSFLLAFIAPVIMTTGCQITQNNDPAIFEHNQVIKSMLKPLDEHFTGHALLGCENKITLDNYSEVMSSRLSGTYGSPVSNSCIPISFNEFEPNTFYDDIISKAKDPESAKEIIEILTKSGYSNGMDGMHIQKIELKNDSVAQIMRFNDGETFQKLKTMWNARDEMLAFIDEYVFLHELFHLSALNLDKSLPKNVREGISDVSTVMVLSTKHQLTLDQTIDLAQDVYNGRKVEASRNPYGRAFEGSHFNKSILYGMINYLEKLQERDGKLQRFATLDEANNYAMDMVLDLNNIERSNFAIGKVYWERGMKVREQSQLDDGGNYTNNHCHTHDHSERRSFNEILTIAQDIVSKPPSESELEANNQKTERSSNDLEITDGGYGM